MKVNNYNKEKIIDKLYNRGYTGFININELNIIKGTLKKNEYNILELYPDCSKVILYRNNIPEIKLYKIKTYNPKKHQEILGTIYSLGITDDNFGDIIKYKENFYIFILNEIDEYFKYNFTDISADKVELEEVDLDKRFEFKIEYLELNYIVSSLRIDNIVSMITNDSRNKVLNRFKNSEVILNYSDNFKNTYTLKEGDIFSIRKFGKYKYKGIIKNTKSNNYVIKINKYV